MKLNGLYPPMVSKVIYKKHQLRKVEMRPAEQKMLSLTRREYYVEIRKFKGIACVSGKAALENDDETVHIGFIENWIMVNGGWKLQFVTFEEI
ncbi:nuclear transport factor 2 family protein [Enterobacter cloacae]|uniref:nuclear transport factor 2 family protein n=1 Tax=Enterobacter cloacae TaxID=550 RepID=UPI001E3F18C9|nr:nuclear transport factor 2 family protein [Enterobacter cloacae]